VKVGQFRSLGTVFQGNTEITAFNELVNFTSLTSVNFRNSTIERITLPHQITTIPNSSFQSTSKLASCLLHEGITSIGISSFQSTGLKTIVLPTTLKTIGQTAFYLSSLTSVTIPANVTAINGNAFLYCYSMQYVIVLGTTPATIAGGAFGNQYNKYPIYVPDDYVDVYKASWSAYASLIHPVSELEL